MTSTLTSAPEQLSQSCLYTDTSLQQISAQLKKFTPNYQLWSDGSNKSRWIYLPANTQINSENPDRWIFPVGTQIFKEFRQITNDAHREIKVETRHLQKVKTGHGFDSWIISTYLWNKQQTDAYLSDAKSNVLNTDHDIPSKQDCIDCHKGNIDFILGFEAIQLSDKQGRLAFGHGPKRKDNEWTLKSLIAKQLLTHPIKMPVLPGTPLEQKALGYLHANCGNCHNKLGHAADQEAEHLKFRHELAFDTLAKTDVYKSAVNQKTHNFTAVPYIILGAQSDELALYQSALYLRMNSLDENYRMPMLATEKVDYQAMSLMHQWLLTLPTPENVIFNKTQPKQAPLTAIEQPVKREPLTGPGLQVEIQLFNSLIKPPVLALYWSEDSSLNASAIMDHQDGFFTKKLIVGNKGSKMSLRNSDEVGHTIYVKDKKQNIRWQLNYMSPNTSFEQELYWDNDIFVEMKCRLHLYMSSWVGSISSKYYKIVEFAAQQNYKRFAMSSYPENFKKIKIWMPNVGLLETSIEVGEQQSIELKVANQIVGVIRLNRAAQ
ncbi:MAG: hypothetical protein MJK10_14385 [Pseudomonadales bacterium]|nr:hypothetical protein [Pseudomonadales bacterium]NRA17070.1 hypothetical protein [Oceanospirillaceae bacterium]